MKQRRWWLGGLVLTICLCAVIAPVWSQTKEAAQPTPAGTLTAEQRQRNLESFEFVWQTIRDKHWDPKLGGLDWKAVHDEYRPQMEKAITAAQCRQILNEMIHRLGQSHFAIIPEQAYREINKGTKTQAKTQDKKDAPAPAARDGVPGFAVGLVEGQPLVVKVERDSSAAKMGVRTGWQILRIGDEELAPALAKVRETNKNASFLDYQLYLAVVSRLRGKIADKLTVVFLNGEGKEATLALPLAAPAGFPAQFGNLPTIYVSFEARKLPGNIGYFFLNAFFDPVRVMKALEDTVKANLQADGFIIDLRGNPGGIGAMAMGVGNWFVNAPNQKLGTLFTRDISYKFVLNPRLETFDGPLAILVDRHSASTSEILAGGLQDLKRARIFGERSAGAALPSQIVRLPNGDGFQYAFANYLSTGGKALEARGVIPDVEVPLRRQALLKGQDAVLDAAAAWIAAQKKTSKGTGR
jgi:carboxyl-terminal processing protease